MGKKMRKVEILPVVMLIFVNAWISAKSMADIDSYRRLLLEMDWELLLQWGPFCLCIHIILPNERGEFEN
jgi:hypothetical protein